MLLSLGMWVLNFESKFQHSLLKGIQIQHIRAKKSLNCQFSFFEYCTKLVGHIYNILGWILSLPISTEGKKPSIRLGKCLICGQIEIIKKY